MRNINIVIKQIMKNKTDKKILGRWIIENCEKRKEQQIYLANRDYGNPEGFYNINKYKEDTNDVDTQIRARYMV
jgi:hypothetical protein